MPSEKTLFDAKQVWSTFVAVGEAALALREARDLVLTSSGNTLAASTLHVLYESAHALVRELGAQLTALQKSTDSDVRDFVRRVLASLHAERSTVPPSDSGDA
jgi:hypothetical protein